MPRANDPQTGRPFRLLIPGPSYDEPGLWQKLSLSKTPQLLERQVRVLRAKMTASQPVDTRGAYLESLVLNIFGGPGTTQVWIDQIEIDGSVPPAAVERVPGGGLDLSDPPPLTPQDRPQLKVNTLQVQGRPFFPRVIEHCGETFELCQELGFNTIYLAVTPTDDQLHEARRLGLWLICPPPEQIQHISRDDQRILGWFCGDDVSERPLGQGGLNQIRRDDPCQRPLIAGAGQNQWVASRQIDILLRTRQPLGTSFELAHFGSWLQDSTRLVRPGAPFWSVVQTQLPDGVVRQLNQLLGQPSELSLSVEGEQMRQLALASLAAGARGLWFRSRHSLNADDPDAHLRRLLLQRLNLELLLAAPWAKGGQRVGEVAGQNPDYRVVALSTERSRLLIPHRTAAHSQLVCPASSDGNRLVVAGVPDSIEVFLLSPVGLQPVRHQRISGGLRLETDPLDSDALILLTQDPLVVSHLNRVIARIRERAAELEYQIADVQLQQVKQRSAGPGADADRVAAGLEEAQASLQNCRQLLQSQDAVSAYRFARQAQLALSRVRTILWSCEIQPYGSPLAHPAGAAFALSRWIRSTALPLADEAWSTNLLAEGECEQLDCMLAHGWRQHQAAPEPLRTYVALSPREPHSGKNCLRLRAEPGSRVDSAGVLESPPVWINTAPVTVRPGQIVRISGWIRIDQPIQGSPDGCLISDSISGPDLALRWHATRGWQPFQMFRAIDQHGHLTVTIALSGLGEVWLDDLRICTLRN